MNTKKRIYSLLLAITALVLVTRCDNDSDIMESWNPTATDVQIALDVNVDGEVLVRSASATTFDLFDIQLVKVGGSEVETKLFKKFDFSTNKIYIDGVEDGSYDMYILAASGDIAADGARVNSVQSIDDSWLEFTDNELSAMEAFYYQAKVSFDIVGGNLAASLSNISLQHMLGCVTFKPQYRSYMVEDGTKGIYVESQDNVVSSSFSLAGEWSNAKSFAPTAIEGGELKAYLPPTLSGTTPIWVLTHECEVTTLEPSITKFNVESDVKSAVSRTLTVNLVHDYDDYGMRYFTQKGAANYGQNGTKYTKIFTQDEDPSYYIYSGSNPRSVKLQSPNALTAESARPALKRASFFNMQRVENVEVFAKIDGSKDRYRILQFDELPPFVELENIEFETGAQLFQTQDGRWHRIDVAANSVLSDIEVVYSGEDSFSKFIGEIIVPWDIQFNKAQYYAAFDDGRYARECLCQMFNIAWIFSQDAYWEYLYTELTTNKPVDKPDVIWTDQGDGISFETYKDYMLDYSYFRIGRVPNGHGVAGYGQPNQIAVIQSMWLYAFSWSTYRFNTIIHEMGHGFKSTSLSYYHISNLVTGNGSATSVCGICQRYFSSITSTLPFPTQASIQALEATHTIKN